MTFADGWPVLSSVVDGLELGENLKDQIDGVWMEEVACLCDLELLRLTQLASEQTVNADARERFDQEIVFVFAPDGNLAAAYAVDDRHLLCAR